MCMSWIKRASFAQEFRQHCEWATKSHLWNGRSKPTMTPSTHTAIFFRLSVQTSSIVYLGVWSRMSQTKRASFVQESCHCVGTTKTHVWNGWSRSSRRPLSFCYQYRPHILNLWEYDHTGAKQKVHHLHKNFVIARGPQNHTSGMVAVAPAPWCCQHIRPFSFSYQYRPHL
jgi:hypothetical protein